jgi:dolichyl-phosphate-mannose-protein mannosyltransferase
VARRNLGQYLRAGPAGLVRETGKPVSEALGEHWATWGPLAVPRAGGIDAPVDLEQATPDTSTVPIIRAAVAPVRSAPDTSVLQRRVWWFRLTAGPWPLLCVLAVQAALSLRLVWTNTAFQDEALYLWAGRMEWAHWLHGTQISTLRFSAYFSGAPIVYPPLGALADHIGGLAAARLLSLVFMLAATVLLHGMTRRLFDRRAAFFAAALFAATAATEFVGAFATYDALAIFLLALAAWLGVRVSSSGLLVRLPVLCCASMTLALADATKYMSTLFDPVVIAVVVLAAIWAHGRTAGALTALVMTVVTCTLIAAELTAGGSPYLHAVRANTLKPERGAIPIPGIMLASTKWIGIVTLLALIGVAAIMFNFRGWAPKALGVVLACAVFPAPVSQAHIHVIISLFKHVGYGAWFGCAVAGYALASLARAVPPGKDAGAFRAGLAVVAASGIIAAALAGNHFRGWPASSSFIAAVRPVIAHTVGPIAAGEDDIRLINYYLPGEVASHEIEAPTFFSFVNPETGVRQTGAAAYAEAIRQHWFGVIALAFWGEQNTDKAIQADVERYGGYRLVNVIPYTIGGRHNAYRIWVRSGR